MASVISVIEFCDSKNINFEKIESRNGNFKIIAKTVSSRYVIEFDKYGNLINLIREGNFPEIENDTCIDEEVLQKLIQVRFPNAKIIGISRFDNIYKVQLLVNDKFQEIEIDCKGRVRSMQQFLNRILTNVRQFISRFI